MNVGGARPWKTPWLRSTCRTLRLDLLGLVETHLLSRSFSIPGRTQLHNPSSHSGRPGHHEQGNLLSIFPPLRDFLVEGAGSPATGSWIWKLGHPPAPAAPYPACPLHSDHSEAFAVLTHVLPYGPRQATAAIDLLEGAILAQPRPVVLFGDFNARPASAGGVLATVENQASTADHRRVWRRIEALMSSCHLSLLSTCIAGPPYTHRPSARTLDLVFVSTCIRHLFLQPYVVETPLVPLPLNVTNRATLGLPASPAPGHIVADGKEWCHVSDHHMVVIPTRWPLPPRPPPIARGFRRPDQRSHLTRPAGAAPLSALTRSASLSNMELFRVTLDGMLLDVPPALEPPAGRPWRKIDFGLSVF